MQGCVYLIENKITNEKYIGATTRSADIRFREHCKDAQRFKHRRLYKALNQYGAESFCVKIIETCDSCDLAEREKYWISHYNTFLSNGYNETYGGKGKQLLNDNDVAEIYKETLNQHEVSKILGCHETTIHKKLNKMNIDTLSSDVVNKNKLGHKLTMINFDTNEVIRKFDSQVEAGKWLIDHGCTKINDLKKLSYVVGRAARGLDNRKQAYGYKWAYA